MNPAIKTATVYVTTDGVSHPAPGLAIQHQMWLDVQEAVESAANGDLIETAAFTRDDRDNPVMHEKYIPKFVADNSNLLLTILTKAFGAKADNAEALGVEGTRRKFPPHYLVLEVDGDAEFDPDKNTVYDALDGGASWVCTTDVDPRTLAQTLRSLHAHGQFDVSGTESAQGLADLKLYACNLARALGAEGWL